MATVPQILIQHLQENPDRVAVHRLQPEDHKPVTYRDLMTGAAGYGKTLEEAGIQPGEVVVLILQHGEDLIYAFFGAIMHGAIPAIMPFLTEKLQPDRYRRSLASLIAVTKPAVVVTYPEFMGEVLTATGENDSVRAVVNTDQVKRTKETDLAAFAGLSRSPDDLLLLQHSSGTTGLQKGVALSHKAVLNQVRSYAQAIDMTPEDVVVSWLPLYHDMGLIAGFIMPILLRAPLVLMSPFDWVRAPYRLLRAVSDYQGTLTWLPNFAYNFCAQKIRDRDLEGVDLSSWRAVINCSEPMRWRSHQLFLQRFEPYGLKPQALATCYAMAENVFAVTQGGVEGPVKVDEVEMRALQEQDRAIASDGKGRSAKMLSAGQPIENTEVRVVDSEGRDLPERQVGEIALRSNCMLTEYFHRPNLTEKAFQNGWYLTGDLGYIAEGELYVTGRRKEIIIVGGKNIYPQDLEELVGEVPGVHPGRVVVFGIFNEEIGTEEVVVVAEADTPDAQERKRIEGKIRACVNQGADVAVRYIKVVDRGWLVKTSSGKMGRNLNREKYLAEGKPESTAHLRR
jgi:acyl-CoA synthetase (AMP-forming)/AMP-acid ligase II